MESIVCLHQFIKISTKTIIILILLSLLPQYNSASCTRQRCCSLSTCTTLYCQQQSSQTWISTQSYSLYQYTKLVMVNNQCKPCSYNCKRCSNENICTQCYDGYYMTSTNTACKPCDYKCTKCQVINNISKCSLCDDGAYLDSTTSSCKLCPVGAKTCVDSSNIIQCISGYLKSSNSLFCTPCIVNCLSCPSTTSNCTVCGTGYFASNGICKICNITNCQTCVAAGSLTYCSLCNDGYYRVNNTVCGSCPLNCKTCSTSTLCTTCKTNYFIQAGGCSAVTTLIPNCIAYSNQTTNTINKCTSCATSFYLSSTSLQCIPCSLTCTACYGDHFGRCTACATTAKLFNQMCLPLPYIDSNKMQLYFTPAANIANFVGGSAYCAGLMYQGSTISISLNNMAAYKLLISYRLLTDIAGQQFSVTLNTSTTSTSLLNPGTTSTSFTQSSSSLSYQLCTQYSLNSSLFSASSSSLTFTTVQLSNTLVLSSSASSLSLYLMQIVVVAYKCSSLCIQCSQTICFTCLTSNLYKQDAYCVYTCSKGYYTYEIQKQCTKECPLGTYGLLTNATCLACVSPCMTCLNDKYCLSCIAGYFLDSISHTCQQQCPYRYYGSIKTQKCEQCVGRCNQCLSDQQCLSCNIGFLSNQTCVDTCPNGQYQNLTTLTCINCSLTCLTCTYTPTYCTSCNIGAYLLNFACVSSCPPGYWNNTINGSGLCLTCSYPCQKCINAANLCVSCVDGYLLNGACYSSCPVSYYQQNVMLLCLPCNSTCTKCLNSANNCLQCISNLILFESKCIPVCPQTYYSQILQNTSTTICTKCSGSCYTCLNSTYCLSCVSNFLVSNISSISGICVRSTECQISQYADIHTLSCKNCSISCFTCIYSQNYCTGCISGKVLWNNTCIDSCPSSYFYQSITNISNSVNTSICAPCQQPCLTCTSSTRCLSCIIGYKFSQSSNICSSTCSIGSFFNSTINDCQVCSTNCLTCTSTQFCSICNTSTYLHILSPTSNQCVTSCPNYYYVDGGTCMQCLYPCLMCTSSIACLSCQNGLLYQNKCLSGCPASTYMNSVNNSCDNCQLNCLTCKSSPTQCSSCINGFYFIQANSSCVTLCPVGTYALQITKSCISCPQTCSACLNNSYCTSCIQNRTYLSLSSHACLQYCPSAFFGDTISQSCQPCPVKCETCSSSSQCLTCSSSYLMVHMANASFDCYLSCPSRTYNQSSICYQCTFPCLQCSSATQCITCASGTYFHNASKSCLLQCSLGTYYQKLPILQCKQCISPCLTCKDSATCISCISGYLLNEGTCVLNCPVQYYADDSGICNRCYGMCKTCSGKYQCLTCHTGFMYSGYCYSSCPPGTFASQITSKCQPCQSPCLQCTSNSLYCKKCQNSQFAYRGSCSSKCPSSTYPSGQICLGCQFPCISCQNQFSCDQCIGGYLLYMKTSCIVNAVKCPNDLYKLDSKQCVPSTWCPANYYRDEQIKTCSYQCSRDKYVDLQNKWCINQCPSGYYVGQSMVCKKWTTDPPISLMGMSALVYIKNSQINIAISFNQSYSWLENSQNLYTIQNLDNTRRLLSYSSTLNYTQSTTTLLLQITQIPYKVSVTLPAYFIKSSQTNYNLQTSSIQLTLPSQFTAYTYQQVYTGSIMKQFSEGMSWFIILFSMIFLIGNRLSDVYILWDTAQLLYLIVFLDMQLPPNLNDFIVGLSNINFLFVPSLFSQIVKNKRMNSSSPFYAHSYDNSFMRTAGSPLLLIVIVLGIFLILKFIQSLSKCSQKFKQKLSQYPKIKNYVFKGLLRFRWHHTSDAFFLTYDIIVLFSVAQISNIIKNPNNIPSNVVCITVLLIYLAFPCFVSYKLYKHFNNISKGKMVANLQCFYRGIQKTNKFGISLILIRYFRKLTYGIIIGIFSTQPMFALPILTFTSVLLGLFIFINKPFKKKLSNIINVTTQISLVIVFIIMALIQFGQDTLNIQAKMILGWVCCGILLIALLTLIFQIFCKTMFYLEPQKIKVQKKQQGQNKQSNQLTKKFSEQYIRQKAGQFFDRVFPKLKQNFNLDQSQQDLNQYEQGDSQNSQNNQQRQKNWGLNSQSQSSRSDQFRHYGTDSQGGSQTQAKQKTKKKAPNYLIRCVKQLK